MKNLLYILTTALLISFTVNAQPTTNELSTSDFNQIKVNGVLFTTVKNTIGNESALTALFGTPTNVQEGLDGLGDGWRELSFNNISFNFDDVHSNTDTPEVTYLSAQTFEVLGITISVGDDISTFLSSSNFQSRTRLDGMISVSITWGNGDCCPFIIEYNCSNIVTSIKYFVWS